MKYWFLVWLVWPACTTKANPEVCCTTNADCARLGGISPRGCPDGFVCRSFLCEEANCADDTDCPVEQPVCNSATASCVGCNTNADCDGYANAPFCDPSTNGCRACSADAECISEVCEIDTGRCIAEGNVIYASPIGVDTAPCTHAQPCSTARAIVVASADPLPSIVRILPGTYATPVVISSGVVALVGTGATLRSAFPMTPYLLEVRDTAIAEIRGLEIFPGSTGAILSRGDASLFPVVTVRESRIEGTAFAQHGTLRLLNSVVRDSNGETPNAPVIVSDDGTLEADRTRFLGSGSNTLIRTSGSRLRVRITNSILEHVTISLMNADLAPDVSHYYIGFSTFALDSAAFEAQICANSEQRIALFENNIFFSPSPENVIINLDNSCTFVGNITHPQDPLFGETNIDQDPKFVSFETGDFRLQPGSPAIDIAAPTSGPNLDHDFAGTPRPQGNGRDVGAFELGP